MPTTHLSVPGLRDIVANGHLEKSLESIPGVQFVALDRTAEEAVVEHDGVDPARLTAAAAELGFRTHLTR